MEGGEGLRGRVDRVDRELCEAHLMGRPTCFVCEGRAAALCALRHAPPASRRLCQHSPTLSLPIAHPPNSPQARYYREKLRVSGEAGRREVVEAYIQVGWWVAGWGSSGAQDQDS